MPQEFLTDQLAGRSNPANSSPRCFERPLLHPRISRTERSTTIASAKSQIPDVVYGLEAGVRSAAAELSAKFLEIGPLRPFTHHLEFPTRGSRKLPLVRSAAFLTDRCLGRGHSSHTAGLSERLTIALSRRFKSSPTAPPTLRRTNSSSSGDDSSRARKYPGTTRRHRTCSGSKRRDSCLLDPAKSPPGRQQEHQQKSHARSAPPCLRGSGDLVA